eukprot:CAMPEP_0194482156 /NCGR_PEP_ID=MMETSP0253-20130528/4240_1 /TAXON_ID=2966 /ORGANISM="Noctiluca scintillans" /LENGTH=309 /DNA_ID=CAMNT_0039321679 /DNA_START=36 /DNA_END=965 /DNA_ORIENTATION=+
MATHRLLRTASVELRSTACHLRVRHVPVAGHLFVTPRHRAQGSWNTAWLQHRTYAQVSESGAQGSTKKPVEGAEEVSSEHTAQKAEAGADRAENEQAKSNTGGEETANADEKIEKSEEKAEPAVEVASESAPEPEPTPLEKAQKELTEAQELSAKKKHNLLLAFADFENKKKKQNTERASRKRNAIISFARRIVGLRAEFNAAELSEPEGVSESARSLRAGITLTEQVFLSGLSKFDVEQIKVTSGDRFNVAHHEKVGEADVAGEAGAVCEVVAPGWIYEPTKKTKLSVLSKAKVKVVSNKPPTPPPPQ